MEVDLFLTARLPTLELGETLLHGSNLLLVGHLGSAKVGQVEERWISEHSGRC